MDLYKDLKLETIRKEPDVWVRRLVIYKQIAPDPVVIREVNLSKGLNIIWAEEPENEDASAEINGHSAGKTTFCRFLRYVLGEKTYGTKSNMDLIRKALPGAYIGAELFVRQKLWAVIRPIGTGRNSYILPDSTIEELLKNLNHAAYQDDYPQKIGLDALLDSFETGSVVRTGASIEWGHILAWCTRDQEARFQNIYDWRSPRSESEWPNFQFSKADPLFVMRATLGLFLPDELEGEEKLAGLLKEQKRLEKEIEELKREPLFRVNLYDRELRGLLKKVIEEEVMIEAAPLHSVSLLQPGLDRLTLKARENIESKISTLEKEKNDYQELVDELGAKIRDRENTITQLERYFEMGVAAKTELDHGIDQRNKTRSLIDKYADNTCLMGDILYAECSYVKERQGVLKFTHVQDKRTMQLSQEERNKQLKKLNDEKERVAKEIKVLQDEREAARTKRDEIQADLRERQENLRDIDRAFQELVVWAEKTNAPDTYPRLEECRKKLGNTTKDIEDLEKGLGKLLAEHDSNRNLLAAIFSGAVRSVLQSGTYDGRVNFTNRELAFMITHGPAMTGEAVETLSVLLADVASLIFTTVSEKSRFPGFLLHDSPREADLGARIYRSFIRFIASLQGYFGGPDSCPFQYILTTTTAPPKELQTDKTVKLQLSAAVADGLLLHQSLALSEGTEETISLF